LAVEYAAKVAVLINANSRWLTTEKKTSILAISNGLKEMDLVRSDYCWQNLTLSQSKSGMGTT
jgi:hypothetical protein